MTFERDGIVFNLLDTPGHADFSEDTYRTLSAVDAAVMVIDAAKGIESQTRKLFEVCRLRDIPIITFINKVDREGRDPLALLDEIAVGTRARRGADDLADRHGRRLPAAASTSLGKRLLLPGSERTSAFERAEQLAAPRSASWPCRASRSDIARRALEGLELARIGAAARSTSRRSARAICRR